MSSSQAPAAATVAPAANAAGAPESFDPLAIGELMGTFLYVGGADVDAAHVAAQVMCYRCERYWDKNECQTIGRGKKIYKCNACNALQSRINRVCRQSNALATDWCHTTPEQQKEFYRDWQLLEGDALKIQMEVSVGFTTKTSSKAYNKDGGKYLPLSVYVTAGYSEAACENIKKMCSSKFDPILNEPVCCLDVQERGHEASEEQEQCRTMRPLATTRPATRPALATEEEVKPDKRHKGNKNTGAGQAEGDKDDKVPKKTQNFKPQAKKLIGGIAPMLSQLKNVITIVTTSAASDRLPPYMVENIKTTYTSLTLANDRWTGVLNNAGAEPDKVEIDKANDMVKQSAKFMKDLGTVLAIAGLNSAAPTTPSSASGKSLPGFSGASA